MQGGVSRVQFLGDFLYVKMFHMGGKNIVLPLVFIDPYITTKRFARNLIDFFFGV